jgi:hypothetical protein
LINREGTPPFFSTPSTTFGYSPVLVPVVNRVNEIREARGIGLLPKITPHALHRTYISLMLEAGAPLPYVMDQVGHADSKTTLEIYAQVQKRFPQESPRRVRPIAQRRGQRHRPSPSLNIELSASNVAPLATLTSMFTGPRRPCWATLWATEAAHPRQGDINQARNTCKSIWARLGLNQRPLACEAMPRQAQNGTKALEIGRKDARQAPVQIVLICGRFGAV